MDLIFDIGYLVDRCIESLGGRTALQNISSFYSRTELSTPQGKSYLDTYRAAGGLIRFEERTEEGLLTVTIVSGLSGIQQIFPKTSSEASQKKLLCSQEVEQIRRSVKLYPRNFLIHTDEYSHMLSKVYNTYILHLPFEEVDYYFDIETLNCLKFVDFRLGIVTHYEDYRTVAGILTPFVERKQENDNYSNSTILEIEYNKPLDQSIFEIDL